MKYEHIADLISSVDAFRPLTFVLEDGTRLTVREFEGISPGPDIHKVAYLTVMGQNSTGENRRMRFELDRLSYVELSM